MERKNERKKEKGKKTLNWWEDLRQGKDLESIRNQKKLFLPLLERQAITVAIILKVPSSCSTALMVPPSPRDLVEMLKLFLS